jgi:hypothetical protein
MMLKVPTKLPSERPMTQHSPKFRLPGIDVHVNLNSVLAILAYGNLHMLPSDPMCSFVVLFFSSIYFTCDYFIQQVHSFRLQIQVRSAHDSGTYDFMRHFL